MTEYEMILIALLLSALVFLILLANISFYSKEKVRERIEFKNIKRNPVIHEDCYECVGTGQDPSWGTCGKCEGRGFLEKSNNEKYKSTFYD